MRYHQLITFCSLAFGLQAFSTAVAASDYRLSPIAQLGDAAPHDATLTLDEFPTAPVINNHNFVLFSATDSAGNNGLFLRQLPGAATKVVLTGDLVPNTTFAFTGFSYYEVADSGDILVVATVEDSNNPGTTVTGVYLVDSAGGIHELAREGLASPIDPAITIDSLTENILTFPDPVINAVGQVAFYVKEDTGNTAILFGDVSALQLAARDGDLIPLRTDQFTNLETAKTLVLNDLGELSFHGVIDAAGSLQNALFIGTPGNITVVAEGGAPVPTLPGVNFNNPQRPAINNSGNLLFLAGYNAPNGVGANSTNPDTQVATEGQPLANSKLALGEVLDDILGAFSSTPVLNDNSIFAFEGIVDYANLSPKKVMLGGLTNQAGILVREGESVDNFTVNSFFSPAVVNQHDFIVFENSTVTSSSQGVLVNKAPNLHKMIAFDDIFTINGNQETVDSIEFQGGSGNHDGRPSGFNDNNIPVMQVSFDSGAAGVFVAENCDLDENGIVTRRDVSRFKKVCKQHSAIVRCDRNNDGVLDNADKQDFRLMCF